MIVKYTFFLLVILLALPALAAAGDLYKVGVASESDAVILRQAEVEPVCRLTGAYLILTDTETAEHLESAGLEPTFLAADVHHDQLAVDNRFDRENVKRHRLVYEDGAFRIFKVSDNRKALGIDGTPLTPIGHRDLEIVYTPILTLNNNMTLGEDISLDSLIDRVSQDSADTNLHRLQDFQERVTGTDSLFAARDWIAGKFASYGYSSVVIDTFFYNNDTGYNVMVSKMGTRYPGREIIVGGHFDAVPGVPGADDNGSGTVGVLEVARAMYDVETEMTFHFIAFDAEEVGLRGSRDYADSARARGDTIVYMLNMDMIGHINNDTYASLYNGAGGDPYSLLWGKLADSLVGITGVLRGSSGGSDHYPFQANGYDVTFVQEFNFSPHWHQPTDSTTNINFEYMTRMIKASLATVYVVNEVPKPVIITSILDVGDGQSLRINWEPVDPTQVEHLWLHYTEVPAASPDSILVPPDSSSYVVGGLTEGQQYSFHIIAYDFDGRSSVAYKHEYGTPYSIPVPPLGITALPLRDTIMLSWLPNNEELDFHHYSLFRDGAMLPDSIYDTVYYDDDPGLDTVLHEYFVVAVDIDGNMSDTMAAERAIMKTARLTANHILAVNRSASNSQAMVNEVVTGELLREALAGWTYDYYSDTASNNPDRVNMLKMIDYELVVIGGESGRRQDDIGQDPSFGGILEDIAHYLLIGGKVIIFGRWGDIAIEYAVDSVFFNPNSHEIVYTNYFDIAFRVLPLSYFDGDFVTLESDFGGAYSQLTEYPDLIWDEAATIDHTGFVTNLEGIPCPTLPFLIGGDHEIMYTYNSLTDSALTEGQPIAWRYLGNDYKYVFFEIPLSFMERPAAVTALRQAVTDMGIISDVDDETVSAPLPKDLSLSQNYPNPFNPSTIIEFYNPGKKPTPVSLEIFNILGQRTRLLYEGPAQPGNNRIEWDGTDDNGNEVATGIYFYRLKTDSESKTRKMMLLK
jgi:hypothetical protein